MVEASINMGNVVAGIAFEPHRQGRLQQQVHATVLRCGSRRKRRPDQPGSSRSQRDRSHTGTDQTRRRRHQGQQRQIQQGLCARGVLQFRRSNSSGSGELTVVGVNGSGALRAQTREIADGSLVSNINFSRKYPPLDAIAINGVAGTGRNEVAVLGEHANGQLRLQIICVI